MTIDELLSPVPFVRFLSEFWERQPLQVQRGDANYYEELLPTTDIESRLLGNRNLTPTHLAMYKGREELGPTHWTEPLASAHAVSSVVNPEKLLGALRQGYSMYLNFPERVFPRLRQCLSELDRNLKLKALSHLIISPPHSQGFLPHTDPYGVLVLQLSGAKIWRSYGIRDLTPTSHGVNHHGLAAEPPSETFIVAAGDLLYLPRGNVHSAATTDAHSVHLSLALVPPRGVDLLKLVEGVAEREAFFQAYVPYSFGQGEQTREAYARRFKDGLIELIERTDLFELLDQRYQGTMSVTSSACSFAELFEIEKL